MVSKSFMRRATLAAALFSGVLLTACAPMQPNLVEAGRAQIELPPGDWEVFNEAENDAFDVRPDDVSRDLPMRTRTVGLRGPKGEWQAVFVVQTNATSYPRDVTTLWTQTCPEQRDVMVEDGAKNSPVRMDCLRYKRRADAEFLPKFHPEFAQWIADRKLAPKGSYSHVFYRYSTGEGAYVAVDALIDQRLLRPKTQGNEEFLRAGQPAREWLAKFTEAARTSTAMLDGRLVIPAFPFVVKEEAPAKPVRPVSNAPEAKNIPGTLK